MQKAMKTKTNNMSSREQFVAAIDIGTTKLFLIVGRK